MKVMIITIPSDEIPSAFPPLGSLSVINYARKRSAHEFDFFNIDYHRPAYTTVLERISAYHPDVLGISAVVSTSYAYTKQIARDVKKMLPNTLIVAGGNLCASAEILLRRASVDLCVLGEGERVFLNILRRAETTRNPQNYTDIVGLALLDGHNKLLNTGYDTPLAPEEIWDVDWTDIERDGSLDHYFPLLNKPLHYKRRMAHSHPNYAYHASNNQARIGSLAVVKGCVARCTFCHRWDKGIRHIPVEEVMRRMRHMYEYYNVRLFNMVAETFGTDKRWLNQFLDRVEPYRILWGAGGVRASAVTPELIERMKLTGCTSLIYGNETGSSKMLEVMEKKVSLEDNYNAAKWTEEAGLGNIVQLVIGMPGESPETVRETIEYCKFCTSISPRQDPRQISINYAQALPGTPLYEYARIHELLGPQGEDSEEAYLLRISNRPAADPITFINFTNYSRLTVLSWNLLIRIEVRWNYVARFGCRHYFELLRPGIPPGSMAHQRALKNIEATGKPGWRFFTYLLLHLNSSELLAWYPELFYHLRGITPWLSLIQTTRQYGVLEGWRLFADHLSGRHSKKSQRSAVSLRKVVIQEKNDMNLVDDPAMAPLRSGR